MTIYTPAQRLRYGKHIESFTQRVITTYRLPIETKHALPNWFLVDYRKESSESGLWASPTKRGNLFPSRVDDFG